MFKVGTKIVLRRSRRKGEIVSITEAKAIVRVANPAGGFTVLTVGRGDLLVVR